MHVVLMYAVILQCTPDDIGRWYTPVVKRHAQARILDPQMVRYGIEERDVSNLDAFGSKEMARTCDERGEISSSRVALACMHTGLHTRGLAHRSKQYFRQYCYYCRNNSPKLVSLTALSP
jgi:hypothetical protein